MPIFILTDDINRFTIQNRYLNPKDVKVIQNLNDLRGVSEGIILCSTYDNQNAPFSWLEDRILEIAKQRGISFIYVKK